jgi:hypothetical protein
MSGWTAGCTDGQMEKIIPIFVLVLHVVRMTHNKGTHLWHSCIRVEQQDGMGI